MDRCDGPNEFVYSPLNTDRKEIRVLQLERTVEAQAPLCFRMLTISLLGPCQNYCAVSYTWGTNSALAEIYINGQRIEVPTSSVEALRGILHVLQSSKDGLYTPLWIDAICIQHNEKSWHVAMMKDVYSQAEYVLIWLGSVDDRTARSTVQSLKILSADSLKWAQGLADIQEVIDLPKPQKEFLPYWSAKAPEVDWDALILLLHNRWFTRLWVVQELALARRVTCILGRHSLEWEDLALAFMWAAHRDLFFDLERYDGPFPYDIIECSLRLDLVHSLSLIRKYLHAEDASADQSFFVRLASLLETSEPHDRVYALFGILSHPDWNDYGRLAVRDEPDYDRSLVDVYADMTWASIHTKDDLTAIEMPMNLLPPPVIHASDWPSWVPRYHLGQAGHNWYTGPCYLSSDGHGGAASADEKSVSDLCRRAGNTPLLRLQGVSVAKVERVFPSPVKTIPLYQDLRIGQQEDELLKHFTYLWDQKFLGNTESGWTKDIFRAIAATLVACPLDSENLEVDFADFVLQVQHECEGPVADDLDQLLFEYDYSDEFQYAYLNKLRHSNSLYPSSTTFVQLSGGRFALCPNAVTEGDEVVIMFGADYPWILGKIGDVWKILGPCVVPEIMEVSLLS